MGSLWLSPDGLTPTCIFCIGATVELSFPPPSVENLPPPYNAFPELSTLQGCGPLLKLVAAPCDKVQHWSGAGHLCSCGGVCLHRCPHARHVPPPFPATGWSQPLWLLTLIHVLSSLSCLQCFFRITEMWMFELRMFELCQQYMLLDLWGN